LFGKPALNDIKEQKMTLPLIAALADAPEAERRALLRLVRRAPKSDETARAALAMVQSHGGMDYARQKMEELAREAVADLSALPDSEARLALEHLVEYNLGRTV
ncbi:polyprenyl synthetase family protein, partial [Salmonella enterica]|nr:polyprenyl synthetase family protein [Salmonella enterica]